MNSLLQHAKAVIFDADELLIDSKPMWDLATDELFAKNHLTWKEEDAHLFIGRSIPNIVQMWKDMYGLNGDVQTIVEGYRALFYELALDSKKLQLMPGAKELIDVLVQNNKLLAVATGGHTREKMTAILEMLGIAQYFSVIVSSDDVTHGKPAPDIFLFAATHLGLPKTDCVIVEDAVNGVEAAKAAGIPVIGVQTERKALLEKAGADVAVETLNELL